MSTYFILLYRWRKTIQHQFLNEFDKVGKFCVPRSFLQIRRPHLEAKPFKLTTIFLRWFSLSVSNWQRRMPVPPEMREVGSLPFSRLTFLSCHVLDAGSGRLLKCQNTSSVSVVATVDPRLCHDFFLPWITRMLCLSCWNSSALMIDHITPPRRLRWAFFCANYVNRPSE